MINFIIRKFVKDYEDTENPKVRERYGVLAGTLGVICNIILFVAKYLVGVFTNSISITADSFNNLSDAGSSIVTLAGFKISGKPADDEHPFGHGRMEYIAALIVSFLILLMGFELLRSSFDKIIHPQPVNFSVVSLVVMVLTILVKLWMAYYNKKIGSRVNSPVISAAAADSLNDTMATGAAVTALILSNFTTLPVDGVIGVLVAGFIMFSGVGILKDTVGPLLGESPDVKLVKNMQDDILSYDGVEGIHDFMIHSYGVGRCYASVHVEVSADVDVMVSHDTIDRIEREIYAKYSVIMSIHMDPIITDDERINELHTMTAGIVLSVDSNFSIHDFRVVDGPTHTNLIFDVVVPHKYFMSDSEIVEVISQKLKEVDERYFGVITVDKNYVPVVM